MSRAPLLVALLALPATPAAQDPAYDPWQPAQLSFAINASVARQELPVHGAPHGLAAAGDTLWIAVGDRLLHVQAIDLSVLGNFAAPPKIVDLAADDRFLFALTEAGRIHVIDPRAGRPVRELRVPGVEDEHAPCGLACEGDALLVLLAGGTLLELDKSTGQQRGKKDSGREKLRLIDGRAASCNENIIDAIVVRQPNGSWEERLFLHARPDALASLGGEFLVLFDEGEGKARHLFRLRPATIPECLPVKIICEHEGLEIEDAAAPGGHRLEDHRVRYEVGPTPLGKPEDLRRELQRIYDDRATWSTIGGQPWPIPLTVESHKGVVLGDVAEVLEIVAKIGFREVFGVPEGLRQDGRPAGARLSSGARAQLRSALVDWTAAHSAHDHATTPDRRRLLGAAEAGAKAAFMLSWQEHTKNVAVLASVDDLRALFDKVFHYEPRQGDGTVLAMESEGTGTGFMPADLLVPKDYTMAGSWPSVALLPGRDEGGWTPAAEYLAATWQGTGASLDTLFCIPRLPPELRLDPEPGAARRDPEERDRDEFERIRAALVPLGEVLRRYRLDRERMVLDCGRGACGFGLRLATYFPDRFAGLILRWPEEIGNLRLGSLTGIPMVLLSSEETAVASAGLAARLNALQPGSCTVLEAPDVYPYSALRGKLDQWLRSVRRDLFRRRVVVEPNDARFRNGYWVRLGDLETKPGEGQPRLEVLADRRANRITVKTREIVNFTLLLNDELVDLDAPVTVVVNGKESTHKVQRSLERLVDRARLKFDPGYLFSAELQIVVPQ